MEPPKKRPTFRVKALAWLVATDNMLRAVLSSGWSHFAQPDNLEERDPNPLNWPVLVLSPDQGSDGWCALQFLQRMMAVACELFLDLSHGGWNDVRLALKHTKLWIHILLLTVAVNLSHGPWEEAKLRQAMKEHLDHQSPQREPLFAQFLP